MERKGVALCDMGFHRPPVAAGQQQQAPQQAQQLQLLQAQQGAQQAQQQAQQAQQAQQGQYQPQPITSQQLASFTGQAQQLQLPAGFNLPPGAVLLQPGSAGFPQLQPGQVGVLGYRLRH